MLVMMPGSEDLVDVDYELRDDLNPKIGSAIDAHLPSSISAGEDFIFVVTYMLNNNETLSAQWLST